ncbi:MAG TPA: anion permease [bacterium]|nr:anion permease [bacterium]
MAYGSPERPERRGWHVSLIVLGAALGWLFQPAPDFVVALAMTAAWGFTGLVPISLAFAGFASPTWVLALGAVGLAAAMARSGLFFRLTLLLLRVLPATYTGQMLGLLIGGALTTPLVPLASGRIAFHGGPHT